MAESLLAAAVRLTSAAEALAALTASARVRAEGLDVPPEIARLLAAVSEEILGTGAAGPDPSEHQAVGMATALLRESIALVEHPGRLGGWSTDDPAVLQGIGRLSMSIAPVIAGAALHLPGLHDALVAVGAEVLDVGTGCGWLAIALARALPSTRVTGIDVFEPALELARVNVASEPGGDRVEILERDVTSLDEPGRFDAIWLPLPFLSAAIVPAAIRQCAAALKPGGWLLPGTFGGPAGRLSELLTDLRIVRSGGHPWTADQMLGMLTTAGLGNAQEIERTWPAPVRLFAARRSW